MSTHSIDDQKIYYKNNNSNNNNDNKRTKLNLLMELKIYKICNLSCIHFPFLFSLLSHRTFGTSEMKKKKWLNDHENNRAIREIK